jgi:hypothetical protein
MSRFFSFEGKHFRSSAVSMLKYPLTEFNNSLTALKIGLVSPDLPNQTIMLNAIPTEHFIVGTPLVEAIQIIAHDMEHMGELVSVNLERAGDTWTMVDAAVEWKGAWFIRYRTNLDEIILIPRPEPACEGKKKCPTTSLASESLQ